MYQYDSKKKKKTQSINQFYCDKTFHGVSIYKIATNKLEWKAEDKIILK